MFAALDMRLLDELWGLDDDGLDRNPSTSWLGSEERVETQSNFEGDGAHTRMKRKRVDFQAPARERQRGRNWERAEEEILMELKGKDMDWKSISELLKSKGFPRDQRHCSDKWYALRKHYIEIQHWMMQHPHFSYWDLTDSERIRTVPSWFSHRWYQIFDAARQKPEVRKRVLHTRQKPSAGTDLSPSHSGPATRSEGSPLPYSDIGALGAEIRDLSHTLKQKFAAEEEERIRNMEIKEKKLQLKLDRFQYKRQRDEQMRSAASISRALTMLQ